MPPGCLELRFVRSPAAHALIQGVDLQAARALAGVVGAFTAGDLPDLPDMPSAPGSDLPPAMSRPALARDRVRFVGEAVAVIAADSPGRAEDAAELVLPELLPLPVVVGTGAALASGAAQLFEGRSNLVAEQSIGDEALPSLEHAPVRFRTAFRHGRLAPASIEARAILVVPGEAGRTIVWCSHQAPHRLRAQLAASFHLDPERLRVIVPAVGGAFGGKSATFPEYLVAVRLAQHLGRPIRWVEGRAESLVAATHGRGQTHRLEVGADLDGRLLALRAEVDVDVGAYPQTGTLVAAATALMMSGPYRIPELSVRTRAIVTNTTPVAPYRGAGRPEAAMSLERTMDELSRRVGRDPAEVRSVNFVPPEAFPYDTPTGARYDSGRYELALQRAMERGHYHQVRAEQRAHRSAGTPARMVGVGLASYVERSGGHTGSTEYGDVALSRDGTIIARSGASSQGQGHRTSFGQIVASVFDLPVSQILVVQGDTDDVPEGTGTFASRSTQIGGSALHEAAGSVLEAARLATAEVLEVDLEDLIYASGSFMVAGAPDRSLTLEQLARRHPLLQASTNFASPQAFPFGAHLAVVEIDPETGSVDLRTVVGVDDCGTMVNPLLVEGQAQGSMAQGIGQAMFEGASYTDDGQPEATSFLTYAIPSAADLPTLITEAMETPNPNTPLGTKGAGESGCIGTPAAIMNAIVDALDGYDAQAIEMPVTPEEVWRIIRAGGARAATSDTLE